MSALLRAHLTNVKHFPLVKAITRRNFHRSSKLFSPSPNETAAPPPNLSEALKLNTKFRLSKKELKDLDSEALVNHRKKVQKFKKEINDTVLDPDVKKYEKSESGPSKKHLSTEEIKKFDRSQYESKTRAPEKNRPTSSLGRLLRQALRMNIETPPHKPSGPKVTIPPRRDKYSFDPLDRQVESVGELDTTKIPRLGHKLDRTLFSPGVHFLQDPRTRIYNFSPYLKNIIKYEDFDFDMIEKFVTVSKDKTLLRAAVENGTKFYSSTSSMTSTLTQFYFLLNNYDATNLIRFNFPKFSRTVLNTPSSFLVSAKGKNPGTNETIYSVESDKSTDQEILLSAMGHCLEAVLTHEENDFTKFDLRYKTDKVMKYEEERIVNENSYNYAKFGKFLMRSQLDCYDERLPGNGTFDLKSRAVCSIRYDQGNPNLADNTYQIWKLSGEYESFEREYTDLIKLGALLKYGFQARIGQMDGIFVAYHNINTFFGFQYLPLSDIDKVFYSSQLRIGAKDIYSLDDLGDDLPSYIADEQFKMSLDMWEKILDTIIRDVDRHKPYKYNKPTIRVVMKALTDDNGDQVLRVLAIPLTDEDVDRLQNFSKSFKTSFRDGTPQERLEHLKQHQKQLEEFNESTVHHSEIGVLNYEMDAKFFYRNGRRTKTSSAYSVTSARKNDISVDYNIRSLPRSPRVYLALLRAQTDLLTQGFSVYEDGDGDGTSKARDDGEETEVDEDAIEVSEAERENAMRVYSAVGKVRAKMWEEKDYSPVVYEAKRGSK